MGVDVRKGNPGAPLNLVFAELGSRGIGGCGESLTNNKLIWVFILLKSPLPLSV